ncbi:U-box domain-containing protein 35-like [Solanum lycopersicum]|uniref:RING-type E3 ubiquitin transferase n=1 Tax=Solanum lycopersicum TaxID=4081 RepID=A0A3Q7J5B5_SOLLC|nr:U-box domain-containing protein 35-like [Solanum lycopersicum]
MVSLHGLHEERLVAVAIDKNKGSQYALRWATENVLTKGQKVTLLHVPQTQTTSAPQSPTYNNGGNDPSTAQDSNSQCTDLFLPFRVFCSFKEIDYDLIILEGQDIAKSLIDYVSLYRVQNLILGCPSKNGISRLFTKSDVANTVMKKAPSFCNVYIVSKGKISSTRMASHPLKRKSSNPSICIPPQRNSNFDATNLMSPFPRVSISTNKTSDEVYVAKADNSFSGSDRMSTDTTLFLDCYDNLGSEVHSHRPSVSMNFMDSKHVGEPTRLSGFGPTRLVDHMHSANEFLLSEQNCEENSLSADKIKEMEEKLRRLELQTIQTMEMYHAACKEALREKQKLKELENLRKEDVKKLEEARREKEEALDHVAKEKALRIASKEEAKAAQKKAEKEAEKRKRSERKALKKSEAKKSTIKSLVYSQKAIKYQSLLRILVVLIIFYLYFFEL